MPITLSIIFSLNSDGRVLNPCAMHFRIESELFRAAKERILQLNRSSLNYSET